MRRVGLTLAATVLILLAAAPAIVRADGEAAKDFACTLCQEFVDKLASNEHPNKACAHAGETVGMKDACTFLMPHHARIRRALATDSLRGVSARKLCALPRFKLCPDVEAWMAPYDRAMRTGSTADLTDFRVAPAYALKGYDNVRITVVDNEAAPAAHGQDFLDFFSYNEPFKWVWTNKTLHSAFKPINGAPLNATERVTKTTFAIGTELNVTVAVPRLGQPITVMLFADPCFSGEWVGCKMGTKWDIYHRLTTIMNLAAEHESTDAWLLIGDNFYDPHGILAPIFFKGLSAKAKSKLLLTINGNHDLWQHGSPKSKKGGYDTYGTGYGQYWGQDTAASVNATSPFDFKKDPFVDREKHPDKLPEFSNFFSINHVGNSVFILFSGADELKTAEPYFAKACKYISEQKPDWAFVVNHWTHVNLGCKKGMDAPAAHQHIIGLDGCKEMADRIKYLEGHTHCNAVIAPGVGYRVAGFGMGGGCHFKATKDRNDTFVHNFGFPFLSTHNDTAFIGYLPIVGGPGLMNNGVATHEEVFDHVAEANDDGLAPSATEEKAGEAEYKAIEACIKDHGFDGCRHLGVTWMSQRRH